MRLEESLIGDQADLFTAPATQESIREQRIDLAGGAQLLLIKHWLNKEKAHYYLQHLIEQLPWQQPEIKVYGKKHRIPRLQSWHGDPKAVMVYSGTQFSPQAWHPHLQAIKEDLERHIDAKFNSVLVNFYRNGDDGMGWHADDEPELGREPVIASLSLGAERSFNLRPKKNFVVAQRSKGAEISPIKLALSHGDLLIMRGKTQKFWQHSLPKTKKVDKARLNLTYRLVQAH